MVERLLPAGQRLVHRLDAREALHLGGHRIERLALAAVADAPGTLRERAEHVAPADRGASRSSSPTCSPESARSVEPSSSRNSFAACTRAHASSFALPKFRRSPTRMPLRPNLSS